MAATTASGTTEVRSVNTKQSVSNTGNRSVDNEFDGEPVYIHQQEAVSMFDREETNAP